MQHVCDCRCHTLLDTLRVRSPRRPRVSEAQARALARRQRRERRGWRRHARSRSPRSVVHCGRTTRADWLRRALHAPSRWPPPRRPASCGRCSRAAAQMCRGVRARADAAGRPQLALRIGQQLTARKTRRMMSTSASEPATQVPTSALTWNHSYSLGLAGRGRSAGAPRRRRRRRTCSSRAVDHANGWWKANGVGVGSMVAARSALRSASKRTAALPGRHEHRPHAARCCGTCGRGAGRTARPRVLPRHIFRARAAAKLVRSALNDGASGLAGHAVRVVEGAVHPGCGCSLSPAAQALPQAGGKEAAMRRARR